MNKSTQKLDNLVDNFNEVVNDMKNKLHTGEFNSADVDYYCDSTESLINDFKYVYYNLIAR